MLPQRPEKNPNKEPQGEAVGSKGGNSTSKPRFMKEGSRTQASVYSASEG